MVAHNSNLRAFLGAKRLESPWQVQELPNPPCDVQATQGYIQCELFPSKEVNKNRGRFLLVRMTHIHKLIASIHCCLCISDPVALQNHLLSDILEDRGISKMQFLS